MMKQKSSTESALSDYFFAVYPVSLQFQRDYSTKFHLYFQKNLQIISKHQSPLDEVKKDEVVQFPVPQQIHHFRIQSEKNLDYQWSLYIFRVDMEGDNEQFIESQKITLKNEWGAFKARKISHFQHSIRFNTIRCKLSYVVIIAHNNRQALDLVQKYFNDNKMSAITTDQKLAPQKSQELQKIQQSQVQLEKVEQRQEKSYEKFEEFQIERSSSKVQEKIERLQEMRISDIIAKERNSLQSQSQYKHFEQLLSPRDEQNPKLSTSQMQLGKQIQQIVTKKQNIIKEQISEQEIIQGGEQDKIHLKVEQKTNQGEDKAIKVTNSQILDSNKQVIVPLYKQKRIIIAFICLIALILAGGVYTLSSIGPYIPQSGKRKAKKTKQTKQSKKQVPTKKTKGKK